MRDVGTNRADRITGTNVADRIIGLRGNDRLDGGRGNDTLNGAYGRDRAFGGSGRDFINVATAGPAASVSCGTGRDVARINSNERRRVRGCERVAVFGNNDR